jgi:hypothetical protein
LGLQANLKTIVAVGRAFDNESRLGQTAPDARAQLIIVFH